jgi:hypothetical protein
MIFLAARTEQARLCPLDFFAELAMTWRRLSNKPDTDSSDGVPGSGMMD